MGKHVVQIFEKEINFACNESNMKGSALN